MAVCIKAVNCKDQGMLAAMFSSQNTFVSGTIPNQKHIHGIIPFPQVFVPPQINRESLASAIKKEKSMVENCLRVSGAVLFRGFGLESAEDFNGVVEALGCEEFPYVGGEAARSRVTGRILTANDGISLDKPIGFHNEVAYLPNSPKRIMFFCDVPSPTGGGGETAITHGRTVYKRLLDENQEQFLHELEEKGVRYIKILTEDGPGSWKHMFNTSDRDQAQQRALNVGSSLEWRPQGGARFTSTRCEGVKLLNSGHKVWFNTIAGIQVFKATTSPGSFDATFGSGEAFPDDALRDCMRILEEESVALEWRKGDLLILDNVSVLHARLPSLSPCNRRRILVSLSK